MTGLLALSRGIDRFNAGCGALAAHLVMAAALISAANAFMRYAFDSSSNAWLEIQWYLFAGIVMFGTAHALRRNEHVRVDLIYMSVSDRARLWIDTVGLLVLLFPFVGLMAWLAFPNALHAWQSGEVSASAGGLVRWPVRAIILWGFISLVLQGVSELIKRIAALIGVIALDTSYQKPDQ